MKKIVIMSILLSLPLSLLCAQKRTTSSPKKLPKGKQKSEQCTPVIPVDSPAYLYQLLYYSPTYILTDTVKQNLDFYTKMMETRIKHAQNELDFMPSILAKKAAGSFAFLAAAYLFFNHSSSQSDQKKAPVKTWPDVVCKSLGGLSTFVGLVSALETITYKPLIQYQLKRDKQILALLTPQEERAPQPPVVTESTEQNTSTE